MTRSSGLLELPPDLPVPLDDGACDHLPGFVIPPVVLASTTGGTVALADLPGRTVVYVYPRTGRLDEGLPPGWNEIAGARGCTPQSCAFRDHAEDSRRHQAQVFGLSTQTTDYQREAVNRLHLPFALLSDADLVFTKALRLPTFEVAGMTLIKRLTLVIRDGRVETVFYPVFPPDKNAETVLEWLSHHPVGPSHRYGHGDENHACKR
ncbi:MAG: peroxiredoxin [Chloroflexota bacterium]|nr:peroxiredoxin [Chloroflexota bacterium]